MSSRTGSNVRVVPAEDLLRAYTNKAPPICTAAVSSGGGTSPGSEVEMTDEIPWNMSDWRWDPFRMVAVPSDAKTAVAPTTAKSGSTKAARSHVSSGDVLEVAPLPTASPAKKGQPICQVDGCEAELTSLKEYHLRYKICEFHLKVNSIMRDGKKQRFCQQCGRFHDIGEFDGDKRSCRARLQRHNARRRKKTDPAASTLSKRVSGVPPLRQQDTSSRVMGMQQASWQGSELPAGPLSSGLAAPPWLQSGPPMDVAMDNAMLGLLRDTNTHISTGPVSLDSLPDFLSTSGHARDNSAGQVAGLSLDMFRDDPLNCDPQQFSAAMQSFEAMSSQGHNFGLSDHGFDRALPDLSMGDPDPAAPSFGTYGAGLLAGAQFGILPLQAHQHAPQQPQTPFSLAGLPPIPTSDTMDLDLPFGRQAPLEPPSFDAPHGSFQQPFHHPGLPDMSGMPAQQQRMAPDAGLSMGLSVLDEARNMLARRQTSYVPEDQVMRVSAKLFNCTPAHLPPDLKQNLVGLLRCADNGLNGTVRPGCLHLTLSSLVTPDQASELKGMGIRKAVEHLVQGQGAELWAQDTVLVQLDDEVALVKNGQVMHVLSGRGSKGVFPFIHSLSHLCVANDPAATITITGNNIAGHDNTVLCRSQGFYVPVRVVGSSVEGEVERLEVQVPRGWRCGALQLEVVRGGFLSSAKPVLLLDNLDAVAEIEQLKLPEVADGADVDGLLLDLDRVLEFRNTLLISQSGSEEPVRDYSAEDLEAVVRTAGRLLVWAADHGWAATAGLVLPPLLAAHPAPVGELLARLGQAAPGGLSLLHRAVRSGSVELVELLLETAAEAGYNWSAAEAGPRGITPLHLAALLPDGGAMVEALTELCEDGLSAWETATAEDGRTPADFAVQLRLKMAHMAALKAKMQAGMQAVSYENKQAAAQELEEQPSPDTPFDFDQASRASTNNDDLPPAAIPDGDASETEAPVDLGLEPSASGSSSDDSGSAPPPPTNNSNSTRSEPREVGPPSHLQGWKAKDAGLGSLYSEYFADWEQQGVKGPPTVFDRSSALGSALLVGGIGAATLALRINPCLTWTTILEVPLYVAGMLFGFK